jgi:assimilatory nitrate reductase catalytic subunit
MAILCHCHGVNERKIRQAIDRGARSLDAIGEACRAGTTCGACWPSLEAALHAAGWTGPSCSSAAATG